VGQAVTGEKAVVNVPNLIEPPPVVTRKTPVSFPFYAVQVRRAPGVEQYAVRRA